MLNLVPHLAAGGKLDHVVPHELFHGAGVEWFSNQLFMGIVSAVVVISEKYCSAPYATRMPVTSIASAVTSSSADESASAIVAVFADSAAGPPMVSSVLRR